LLEQLSSSHADAIIFDLHHQARLDHATAQRNAAALHLRSKSMLDAVFDQRLQ